MASARAYNANIGVKYDDGALVCRAGVHPLDHRRGQQFGDQRQSQRSARSADLSLFGQHPHRPDV